MLQYHEKRKMGGERFHAASVPLTFSTAQVSLVMEPGEIREGSFTIYSHSQESVNGFIRSNRLAMKCLTESFSGSREVISYRFDASAFTTGDTVEGFFRIISNHGEYRLPFNVKIMAGRIDSSLGAVRNLYHFTNLARSDWKEAVEVFYRPGFASVFSASDAEEYGIYRGLSGQKGNEANVEEFLITTGKKEAVGFLPARKEIIIDLPAPESLPYAEKLPIRRNGWGYSNLRISAEGSFLHIEKEWMTEADFAEGVALLPFSIDERGLHAGKNLGAIILSTPFKRISIPVTVKYCTNTALQNIHRRDSRRAKVRMMQAYENFRAKKMNGRDLLAEIGACIRKLAETDRNDPLTELYRIHYLITAKRLDEAVYDLQMLARKLSGMEDEEDMPAFATGQFEDEDDVTYAYRMYLTILCAEDTKGDALYLNSVTQDAIRGLEHMYNGNPGNWWIAWLLMYASDEYRTRPSRAWELMHRAFAQGNRSPVLYMEAYDMIALNPAILHELDEFGLQVLTYASRHGLLTIAVMTQVNFLAKRQKNFSAKLLRIMKTAYETEELAGIKRDTIESICSLLIRGNETDSRYFEWYEKGVEQQLPLTRLYEYYMLSLPKDFEGVIPQMVVMYFAYQSTLPYERNAYLYRYVLEHRDQYEALYEQQYRDQIDSFSLDQLMARRIDRNLARLYEHYLTAGRVLTNEIAAAAVPAVFACRIRTEDPSVKRVVLIYDRLRSEQYFPLKDGECCLPIFGEEYHLFFEDDMGNRFLGSVEYTCERMMDHEKLAQLLSVYDVDNFGYDLYLSGQTGDYYRISEKNQLHMRRLCESEEVAPRIRQKIRMELLRFYSESDSVREMDEFLNRVRPDHLNAGERAELIRYMASRGLNERAMAWLRQYGSFQVDGKTLMRICSQFLKRADTTEDPAFAEIVHEAFLKGRYDEDLLLYMESYFDGLTEELEEIRKAAVSFNTDDYVICRRMLIQMLYSGRIVPGREEIIEHYMRGGSDTELLSDVLAQSSHNAFIGNEPMNRVQYDLISRYGQEGVPLVDICRIAWLKDRSERSGEITDAEKEVTALFLEDLTQRDVVFPFFRQFIGVLPQLQAYADETLVEYRSGKYDPDARILYHYAMEKNGVREKYAAREMKEMYRGVYVTGFLLFFGEQLHYYITDDPAEKNIVESGTIGQDARIPEESDDRFGYINRISMLTALGRDEEALERIGSYARRSFIVDRLFMGGKGETDAV